MEFFLFSNKFCRAVFVLGYLRIELFSFASYFKCGVFLLFGGIQRFGVGLAHIL